MNQYALLLALVLSIIHLASSAEPTMPGLPEPFVNGGKEYHHAVLLSVDASGIKFNHDGGTGIISVAVLDPEVKSYISKAVIAMKASVPSPAPPAPVPTAPPVLNASMDAEQVKNDPEYLTQYANVSLTGQVQGGKSRYEPWKTDYGSYERIDTSAYQLMGTLKTLVQTPQRVLMQAFRLSRNLANNEMEITPIGEFKVTFGGHRATTVSTFFSAVQVDVNYNAIGVRERAGDKYLGWIWRAIDGRGHIAALVSSMSAYDKYGYAEPVKPFEDRSAK